jgi:hypothetical protein
MTSRHAAAATANEQQPNIVSGATGVGSRSSEGDVTHLAVAARAAFGVDGTGIKIGVISDGVRTLLDSQKAGDLGPVTVIGPAAPCAPTSTCDEGTAMLEIVHDLAPGAQLYFASAFVSITSFADNIRALRAAGCDVIVDDVAYFVETPFQDGQAAGVISNTNGGVVIQAVKDVTASGALYFSSAGNGGNKNDNTSGVWEGDFADGGAITLLGVPYRLHNFGGPTFNNLLATGGTVPISLYWSDPLGGSANDYDLFRLNAAGTAVAAASTNIQNGTQDPLEQISQSIANPRIVIVKKGTAAPRFLHLDTNRGLLQISTAGATHGHAAVDSDGAYGVAATPAVGPFPGIFNAANKVEAFSSDGPRHIFFTAEGSAITAGNLLASGGKLLRKPDITAADGVSVTGVGGFPNPFFGTSAAAPHAAAIAGLLKAGSPAIATGQARSALIASAIDIEEPGTDRDSGAGIIMANRALLSAGIPGTAAVFIEGVQTSDNPGNGNGSAEAGEGARLAIPLANYGAAGATAVSATLTSPTPGITIPSPAATAYPDLAVSGSAPNASPLRFTIASDFPCPRTARFELTVNYTGGPSPRVFSFDVPIGPPDFKISNTTLDGVAPPASPGVTTSTGIQNFRLFRDSVQSVCGPQKPTPALAANTPTPIATTRQYEAYSFATCAISAPSCVTVTLQGTNAINLFTAAYSPSFDPGNIQQFYKADPGTSAASRTYSFDLPGGPQSFAIDVHDVPQGLTTPSGIAYSLSVTGACLGACHPPNHVPLARAAAVTVPAGQSCRANASVDNGSSDADGDALTRIQSPPGPYALGTTPVLLTVTDPSGAASEATGSVLVVDTTAPAIEGLVLVGPASRPPNHKMFGVTVNYDQHDNCDGASCVVTVTSNEPGDREDRKDLDGTSDDDKKGPDIVIVDAHHVQLRAERSGRGDGRAYTITVTCTDAAGNVTVKSAQVVIPHDAR